MTVGGGGRVTGVAMDSERREALRRHVFAPFYGCADSLSEDTVQPSAACATTKDGSGADMADGMTVVDLADGTVYVFQDPSAPPLPNQPLGGEPDSAAVYLSTQVVVVPSESDTFQNVLDFSRATFDRAARTVTAPAVRFGEHGLEGVAVESNRHLAFLGEAFGTTAGVMDLS